nr:hypothetical protein GCM10020092_065560 [Actinoplanes digitatis]
MVEKPASLPPMLSTTSRGRNDPRILWYASSWVRPSPRCGPGAGIPTRACTERATGCSVSTFAVRAPEQARNASPSKFVASCAAIAAQAVGEQPALVAAAVVGALEVDRGTLAGHVRVAERHQHPGAAARIELPVLGRLQRGHAHQRDDGHHGDDVGLGGRHARDDEQPEHQHDADQPPRVPQARPRRR